MSKIFEALQKTEGEMAKLALPAVAGATNPDLDAQPPSGATSQVAEALFTSDQPPEEVADPEASSFRADELRTLPVRIRADAPILPFQPGNSREGEQYRIARTKILQHPDRPRLMVVSSVGSGDGKTVSAINLAGALALKSDTQVMLVDADLRRSNVAALLGLPELPGLAEYLSGQASLDDIIIRVEQFPNLCVVPAGRASANPAELLDSPQWATTCSEFRQRSTFVIFDAPPMDAVTDYDLIAAQCDGLVMVVRPDRTNRKLCLTALANVPKEKLIGVLLNCVSDWWLWKAKSYYSESAVPTGR